LSCRGFLKVIWDLVGGRQEEGQYLAAVYFACGYQDHQGVKGKMHIPDGFLDLKTWVGTTAVSIGALTYGVRATRERLQEREIPFMAVMAAFIFAAQMINFPIVGATSGHLIGGVLAAILLGPWTASIVMTTILVIQALLFGDGGITVLGANVLNMALVSPFLGYYLYRWLSGRAGSGFRPGAVFVAAWISVLGAAALMAVQLGLSGTINLTTVLSGMLFWHFFIGIGEGLITMVVVSYLYRVRPDLFHGTTVV